MTVILCIETSTRVCSVCLTENGKVRECMEDTSAQYSHAEQLNVLIEQVLQAANTDFKDLDAVAVSEGPGSYTGLRIGVSAAKGIALACGIPIVAVSPLRAMAVSVKDNNPNTLLIPMIDARRMEVFTAGYNGLGEEVFKTRAEILDDSSFPERGDFEKTLFFGDNAEKAKPVLSNNTTELLPGVIASAKGMAALAFKKFQNDDIADTAYFEPFYLKDFVAKKPKKRV